MPHRAHALILGKFLPLHAGHLHLIDTARAECDVVTVVVGPRPDEPIAALQRVTWIHDSRPDVQLRVVSADLPSQPDHAPSEAVFWAQWREALQQAAPTATVLYTSEAYGDRLARELGLQHRVVDPPRQQVPISATRIRHAPHAQWQWLPPAVRRSTRRVVSIAGPESAGKSTLALQLAAAAPSLRETIPEWGRLQTTGQPLAAFGPTDGAWIATAQTRQVLAWGRRDTAAPLLISDTDPVVTAVWLELAGQPVPDAVMDAIARWPWHGVLLCAPDLSWDDDGTREHPDLATRRWFHARLAAWYDHLGIPTHPLWGEGPLRQQRAEEALAALDAQWWACWRQWDQEIPGGPVDPAHLPVDWTDPDPTFAPRASSRFSLRTLCRPTTSFPAPC